MKFLLSGRTLDPVNAPSKRLRRGLVDPSRLALPLLLFVVSIPTLSTLLRGPSVYYRGYTDTFASTLPLIASHRDHYQAHGTPPIWNPSVFAGYSMIGDPQQRVFYPFMGIFALVPMPAALHLYLLVHTWILASGMFFLARGFRCLPLAALFAGISVGLCQKNFTYLMSGWDTIYGAACYAPWVLFFFHRALKSPRLRPVAAMAVALALSILAGTPIVVAFIGLGLPVVALAAFPTRALRVMRTLALSFLTTLLLTAPLALAVLEKRERASRFSGAYGTTFDSPLQAIQALVVPAPRWDNYVWEKWNTSGLAVLPLAFAGMLATRRRWHFPAFLVPFFLWVGSGTGVQVLPVFDQFSYPTRLVWVAVVGLGLLAALGLDALLRTSSRQRALSGGLAAGGLLLWLLWTGRPGQEWFEVLLPLPPLVALPFLPIVSLGRRWQVLAVLVALTAAELIWISEHTLVRIPYRAFGGSSKIATALRQEPRPRIAVVTPFPWHDPVFPEYLAPEIDRIGGYNPLHPRAVADFIAAIEERPRAFDAFEVAEGEREDFPPQLTLASRSPPRSDLLGLGVTHLVTRTPVRDLEPLVTEDLWTVGHVAATKARLYLYRLPTSLPRAYFIAKAHSVSGQRQLEDMVEASFFDGSKRLLVDGPVPPELSGSASRVVPAQLDYRSDLVTMEVDAPEPGGFAVLLDAYSPYWSATVDGRPAAILRANHLYRAVRVPSGHHRVEMKAHFPDSISFGVGASALGLSLAVAMAIWTPRRGWRKPTTEQISRRDQT